MEGIKVPDKIYLTPLMLFAAPQISNSENDVEYVRTDAFIDKACEWLKDNIYHRVYECGDKLGFPTAKFIDDFANYMKGE